MFAMDQQHPQHRREAIFMHHQSTDISAERRLHPFDETALALERGAFEFDAEGITQDFDGVGIGAFSARRLTAQVLNEWFLRVLLSVNFWYIAA